MRAREHHTLIDAVRVAPRLSVEVLLKLLDVVPPRIRNDFLNDEKIEGRLCKFFVDPRLLVGGHILGEASILKKSEKLFTT